jgi:hypothetical protein
VLAAATATPASASIIEFYEGNPLQPCEAGVELRATGPNAPE